MVFDEFPLQGCGRNGDRPLGCAIAQVVAHGPAWAGLGTFKAKGHKFWKWRVLENEGRLFWQHGNQVEVYGHIRRGCYKRICTSHSSRMGEAVASVEEVTPGTMKVCLVASPLIWSTPPASFLDVLCGWGQM